MATREAHATVTVSVGVNGTLRSLDEHPATGLESRPTVVAAASISKRLGSSASSQPVVKATAEDLPGSQRVFLIFRLDRTSVPYIAERG